MSQLEALAGYADHIIDIDSSFLGFKKKAHVYLPPHYDQKRRKPYKLLVINDGQDMQALRLKDTIHRMHEDKEVSSFIAVGIPAVKRIREYGTAGHPDYANRGDLAADYTRFVLEEVIPHLEYHYPISIHPADRAICGFSLGGLSALDICWNHPTAFGMAGIFSGSLWWRSHSANDAEANIDRIMHRLIRQGQKKEGLRFWFEAGTDDEKEDRNKNGIIDAIDDTLDLMHELTLKGYHPYHDIKYVEVEGGQHNFHTWSEIFPVFLKWAFPF